jgi:PAS domain S-box-containing protein
MSEKPSYEELIKIIQELRQAESECKRAKEALADSERRYQTIVEASLQGVYQVDARGHITFANPLFAELTGYSLEELDGLSIESLLPAGKAKAICNANPAITSSSAPFSGEYTMIRKDGSRIETYFGCASVFDKNGEYGGFVGTILDFTKRVKAEEALRESEEKYRSMMEAMIEPAYICTPDFRVEYMNPAMIKRAGYDATGEVCHKAINNLDEKCPWCVHSKIQQGESAEVDIISPKDGRHYQTSHVPIFHQDGTISKMTIYRDITERVRAEEEREKLIRKLQETLEEVKTLSGLLPICANCKKIRDDKGYWNQIESYIREHTEAEFTHSICPECAKKLYPNSRIKCR